MSSDREHEGLFIKENQDRLISVLNTIIRLGIRALAILMTLVILWRIGDVLWVIYQHLIAPPRFILKIEDILDAFGASLAVLIAVEICLNIILYLKEDIIHVKLVVATALMAIARKVIVFDFNKIDPEHVAASGVVIFALGITYWLISKQHK